MAVFRFLGTTATYAGVAYSIYGQQVEMEEAKANALIAASPPALLIPEALWEKWFPVDDPETAPLLAKWSNADLHYKAPEFFRDKAKGVRTDWHDNWQILLKAA
jgi:hypothetical protein